MFEQQGELFSGDIRGAAKWFAGELGLDTQQLRACVDEGRYTELVQRQDEHRRRLGIRTRPVFDINGERIIGPQPYEAFQSVIEPLLAQEGEQ